MSVLQELDEAMDAFAPDFLVEGWKGVEHDGTLWVTIIWTCNCPPATIRLDTSEEGWPGALRARLGQVWPGQGARFGGPTQLPQPS